MIQVIDLGSKVPVLVQSGTRICQLALKAKNDGLNKKDKVEFIATIACTILESSSMAADAFKLANPMIGKTPVFKVINLAIKTVTGFSFVAKEAISMLMTGRRIDNNQIFKLAGVMLFRLSDVTSALAAPPLYCEPIHYSCNGIGGLAKIGGTGCVIASKKESIATIVASIRLLWRKKIYEKFKRKEAASNTNKVANKAIKNGEGQNNEDDDLLPIIMNSISFNNKEEFDNYQGELFESITNPSVLKNIPDELAIDPILSPYKCAITDKCIRFISILEVNDTLIYFEKEVINKALADNNRPAKWPQNLELKSDHLFSDAEAKVIQSLIDKRLNKIADQWNELYFQSIHTHRAGVFVLTKCDCRPMRREERLEDRKDRTYNILRDVPPSAMCQTCSKVKEYEKVIIRQCSYHITYKENTPPNHSLDRDYPFTKKTAYFLNKDYNYIEIRLK